MVPVIHYYLWSKSTRRMNNPPDQTIVDVMWYGCTPTLPCIVSSTDIIQDPTIGIKEILRG